MHLVLFTTLRSSSPPAGVQLTKIFYQQHLDELKWKFEEVKSLGSATAEEWFKGLGNSGKDRLADAARWEQWEAAGGFEALKKPPENLWPGLPSHTETTNKSATANNSNHSTALQNGQTSDPGSASRSPATLPSVYGKLHRTSPA